MESDSDLSLSSVTSSAPLLLIPQQISIHILEGKATDDGAQDEAQDEAQGRSPSCFSLRGSSSY